MFSNVQKRSIEGFKFGVKSVIFQKFCAELEICIYITMNRI